MARSLPCRGESTTTECGVNYQLLAATIYVDDVQLLFSGSPYNLEQLKIYTETSLNTMKEWYSENG